MRRIHVFALCLSGLLSSPFVFAQSASFPQVKGKNCPSGFSGSGGMCTSKNGKKEGMVKTGKGRCPNGFTDTVDYCYRDVK